PGPRIDATVRGVKEGAQLPGMSQEQPLQLVIITHPEQHGHRLTIPRDHNRTCGTGLQVRTEPGLDIGHRSNLHKSTSSPPSKTRFRSFTAIAKMRTCRLSTSTR